MGQDIGKYASMTMRNISDFYFGHKSRWKRGYDPNLPGGQMLHAVNTRLQQQGHVSWEEVVKRADQRISLDRQREKLARKLKARDPSLNVTVVKTPLPSPSSPQYETIQKLMKARAGMLDEESASSATGTSAAVGGPAPHTGATPTGSRIPSKQTTVFSPLQQDPAQQPSFSSNTGEHSEGAQSSGPGRPKSSFRRKTHEGWKRNVPQTSARDQLSLTKKLSDGAWFALFQHKQQTHASVDDLHVSLGGSIPQDQLEKILAYFDIPVLETFPNLQKVEAQRRQFKGNHSGSGSNSAAVHCGVYAFPSQQKP